MVVYELQVQEFYSTFDAVIPQLDYLAGLGVNVIELMPVTDFPQVFDWGYGPLHFFAPEDRWGGSDGLALGEGRSHTEHRRHPRRGLPALQR